jgi:hypothetical protein
VCLSEASPSTLALPSCVDTHTHAHTHTLTTGTSSRGRVLGVSLPGDGLICCVPVGAELHHGRSGKLLCYCNATQLGVARKRAPGPINCCPLQLSEPQHQPWRTGTNMPPMSRLPYVPAIIARSGLSDTLMAFFHETTWPHPWMVLRRQMDRRPSGLSSSCPSEPSSL